MENYVISNETVAILKDKNKTIIYDVENNRVINKNINKLLNYNCIFNGCDLKGRIKFAKLITNTQYKIPIIINNNVILLQLNSIRKDKCLFIVFNKIIDYKYLDNKLIIKCVNNNIFEWKISKYSFEKLLINSIKINNILKWQKLENIV